MDEDCPEGRLVETGGFRVDREKALEKLRGFQSETPQRFLLSLLRCAVLGKASRFEVQGAWEGGWVTGKAPVGLRVRFDGRPFPKETQRDPYGALFAETPSEDRRGALLARALLDGQKLFGDDDVALSPAAEPGGRGWTEVRVAWKREEYMKAWPAVEALRLLRAYSEHAPLTVSLEEVPEGAGEYMRGATFVRAPRALAAGKQEVVFEEGPVSGRLAVPRRISPELSRLAVCSCGVQVERFEVDLPGIAEVDGFIDDQELNLNFPGTQVVRDRRFEELLSTAGRQALRLLDEMAREQARRLPETGVLLADPSLRDIWTAVLNGGLSAEPRSSGWAWWDHAFRGGPEGIARRARVFDDAVRTRWLRYCGRELVEPGKDAGDTVKKTLWETPTYLTTDGAPVSPLDMWERLRRQLPLAASGTFGAHPRDWTLWLGSHRDAPLLPERVGQFLQRV